MERKYSPLELAMRGPGRGSHAWLAEDYAPYGSNYQNLHAPGVLENVANPSMPYFSPFPGDTYWRPVAVNKPPLPNLFDGAAPTWQFSQYNRDVSAEWYWLLNNDKEEQVYWTRMLAPFSVPYTGFGALRDFVPLTTLAWNAGAL